MILDKSLKEALFTCSILVQKKMSDLLILEESQDSHLLEAMRYSALSEGKRLRPFLLITCANLFGAPTISSLNAAAAIEFVHTYSLIHDDLPAMDNDDFRRGNLTSHKKFDEATAILAGDALLTYAFEILSSAKTHEDPLIRCELIKILSRSSGFRGMVSGQMIDIENKNKKITKEKIANIHRLKTGELFMASCEMGAVIGKASNEDKKHLKYFAHDLGLLFQIKDDILDYKGIKRGKTDIDEITKPKNSDNISIVHTIGIEAANQQIELLCDQSKTHLKYFGHKARILNELIDYVSLRSS